MENKRQIDINYKMDSMVSDIVEMKDIINKMYDMEKFVLKLSFETSYSDSQFIRFCLENTIGNTTFNNGLIVLYHKLYDISDIKNFNENEILIKFFEIQKDLKDIKIKFQISDKRE